MSEEQTCPNCSADVPAGADICPECGLNPQRKLLTFALVVVLLGGAAMWFRFPGGIALVLVGIGLAVTSQLGPTVWA
jgi:hypothetical protein